MTETHWQRHTLSEKLKHNERDTLRKTHTERDRETQLKDTHTQRHTQRHTETGKLTGSH